MCGCDAQRVQRDDRVFYRRIFKSVDSAGKAPLLVCSG
jgi:hypothetical protein